MTKPDGFDALYRGSRERLLVSTFALVGDLGAARKAVPDAYVTVWRRWRDDTPAADAEAEARGLAWRLAQRRHAARVWQRGKDLDAGVRATLDALGSLSSTQRRALVLVDLDLLPVEDAARELGQTPSATTHEVAEARSRFLAQLAPPGESTSDRVRAWLAPLAATALDGMRWPRPSLVRRTGTARRRGRTALGAAAAVVVLVASGFALGEGSPVQAGLARTTPGQSATPATLGAPPPPILPARSLVDAEQIGASLPGRTWTVRRTTDNDEALGDRLPCQQARYADPDGVAALLRVFGTAPTGDRAPVQATQFTEASADETAARATYRTSLRWYAACALPRVQLVSTKRPERLGDEAVQIVLRDWNTPVTTYVVGVARTGDYTTTTVLTRRSAAAPDEAGAAQLLSTAVDNLCTLEGAGTCGPPEPELNVRAPVPTGEQPALLSELDLPPVSGVEQPWVGTEPRRAQRPVAATRCDQARFTGSFEGARFNRSATRSFVVPEATDLPEVFGLSETVAALPRQRADAYIDQLRTRLDDCPEDDLGTDAELVLDLDEGDQDTAIYRVTVDVADDQTITYFTALMREGTAVGQLSFVPGPDATLSDGAFPALAARAMERMRELPGPSAG